MKNFLIQRIWKVNVFIKNPNLTKKNSGGWNGEGVWLGKCFFFFPKTPSLKKKIIFFLFSL